MTRWLNCGLAVALVACMPSCGGKRKPQGSSLDAAGYKHTVADWFRAASADDVAALKEFTKAGMDLMTRDADGDTALHVAASKGSLQAAAYLLDQKMPVDVRGANDRTPLMAAAQAGHAKAVGWLLKQGAHPGLKDKEGYKALMVAVREDHAGPIRELAARSRDELNDALLLAALLGKPKSIDALTSYGASIYTRMEDGRTPLMLAAENGHKDATKLLIQIGANRSATDNQEKTAAQLAREAGHAEIADLLDRGPTAEELALETPQEIGEQMNRWVDAANAESEGGGGVATIKARAGVKVEWLEGRQISKTETPPETEAGEAGDFPALIMRHYRQREFPIMVKHVSGKRAQLRIGASRDVTADEGAIVAGTRLRVIRVQERVRDSKLHGGAIEEVSLVELEDTRNGSRRSLIVSVPSTAHDPMALVEDAVTGQRYLAAPGQKFRGSDGGEYVVSDVRPEQMVIENARTHATLTQPLRGPRG